MNGNDTRVQIRIYSLLSLIWDCFYYGSTRVHKGNHRLLRLTCVESIVTGRTLSLAVSNDLYMYKTIRLTIGIKPSRNSPSQGKINYGNDGLGVVQKESLIMIYFVSSEYFWQTKLDAYPVAACKLLLLSIVDRKRIFPLTHRSIHLPHKEDHTENLHKSGNIVLGNLIWAWSKRHTYVRTHEQI